jgi:hypothetical protein
MASATLPEGLFFDLVSEEEIVFVYALEVQGKHLSKHLQPLALLVIPRLSD